MLTGDYFMNIYPWVTMTNRRWGEKERERCFSRFSYICYIYIFHIMSYRIGAGVCVCVPDASRPKIDCTHYYTAHQQTHTQHTRNCGGHIVTNVEIIRRAHCSYTLKTCEASILYKYSNSHVAAVLMWMCVCVRVCVCFGMYINTHYTYLYTQNCTNSLNKL